MSSLNILCSICREYFKNTDCIYSTRCGHVFHKFCIFQWFQRSSSCPQCGKTCSKYNCRQLYMNFTEKTLADNETKTYEWLYIDQEIYFGNVLTFGFKFGQDEEGNDIYAARANFNEDLIPAYYIPCKQVVIAPWGFKSHRLTADIEILDISNDDADYKWVAGEGGSIPEYAFPTGYTSTGEVLYTARAKHDNKILYGKLDRRYNLAYMPYKEEEVSNSRYEILVRMPKDGVTTSSTDEVISDREEQSIIL